MIAAYHANTDKAVKRYLAKKEKDRLYGKPLRLFRQGKDTLEIAEIMGITEADALMRVHRAISSTKRKKVRTVPHGELA